MSIWPPACPPDLTVCWHLSLFGTLVEKVVYLWTLNNPLVCICLTIGWSVCSEVFFSQKSWLVTFPTLLSLVQRRMFSCFQSSFCIVRKSLFAGLAGLTTREVLAGKSYFGNEVRTIWTKVYRVEVSGHRNLFDLNIGNMKLTCY